MLMIIIYPRNYQLEYDDERYFRFINGSFECLSLTVLPFSKASIGIIFDYQNIKNVNSIH